jgi:glycosyltransferase involved in cell wall biosynthesis
MNILFLIGTYPSYGGTEKVTTILANQFCKREYGIHIVSFSQPVPELAIELNTKIQLHQLSYPVKSRSNIKILKNILLQYKIDAIINQWCLPFYITQLCNKARRGMDCKLYAVHHNSPDFNTRLENIRIELSKKPSKCKRIVLETKLFIVKKATALSITYVYHHSDKYILLSDSFVDIFKYITKIKNTKKLLAIPNPVTLIDKNFIYNPNEKLKELIYVGRIDYNQKKIYRIVELWNEIENDYPDWKLIIVGDGEKRQEVETLISKLNLQRIEITGFKNPLEYYKRASILLLTSEYEGFGLVIVEGMTFGIVPVVYGSYSAVYDIIDNGKDGFITNMPYSQQETVNCIKTLIENENLRREMALNAIEKSKKFSLASIIVKWEKLFKEN